MRLLTWNVQWCRGLDGAVHPQRIAAEAWRLADPDVACFQEVACGFAELPGSTGEDQAKALQKEMPRYEAVAGWAVDVPGNPRKRFGNLILSRLPVGRALRHSLPWPPAPDVPSMPRIAVEAVVAAPFGPLRIITTHLEYYSAAHRAAQLQRLHEVHLEATSHRLPVDEAGPFYSVPSPASAILCGDFNMPPGDAPGIPGFVDAWRVLHPGEPHPPTFRAHEREAGESPYCCDYVFVTEDLVPRLRAIRVDGANRASDHQPVIVELE